MTIQNGRFQPKTEAEIMAAMLESAEDSWGRELSEDETATLVHFMRPLAEHFAEQQQDLAEVLDAAQIEHAEGQALDFLASLIGVSRRTERPATGRLQFRSDDRVSKNYTIPQGVGAQTDDADSIRFTTTESSQLPYLDGFTDGNLDEYSGNLSAFTADSGTLNSDGVGRITNTDVNIDIGARFHVDMHLPQTASGGFLFGVQDAQNHYELTLDESADTITLKALEDGVSNEIDSVTLTVPVNEVIEVEIDWAIDGQHEIRVYDESGALVATFNPTELDPAYTDGGYGFVATNSSGISFEEATTSRVSVPSSAEEPGERTNVGPETLIIMSTSINGIDNIINPLAMTGGRDREPDADYRERAMNDLSEGTSATLPAVITAIENVPETRTVTVIPNRSSTQDADGRPGHSFEPIVDAPEDQYDQVANAIKNTQAAGDLSVGGYAGNEITRTIELANGQEIEYAFSEPTPVELEISCTLEKDETYPGDDRVRSSIVRYVGGVLDTGDTASGEIGVGDDIIYHKVVGAIMDVEGVHDITSLSIGALGTTLDSDNVPIANTENGTADATSDNLVIATNDV